MIWWNYLKFVALSRRKYCKTCCWSIIILFFRICINSPFVDSILNQYCRCFAILPRWSRVMETRGVNGPREGVNASGRGGKDASYPVISIPKVGLYGIKPKGLIIGKGLKRLRHVGIKSSHRRPFSLLDTLQSSEGIWNGA